ncbi:MAG: TIR domain-containing protein [Rhodobacteraceae bacterium]|nr:TIR domain-containing protein [Paracoccaceae bacterium]
MSAHIIHVFISHSWSYSVHYDTLQKWIFAESWRVGQASLHFKDYSVPRYDPIHNAGSDLELKQAIDNQISRCSVVIAPTGMYASYSKWIAKELDLAKSYNKPILGVNPWGQERTSSVVREAADITVGWNKESVVKAIWELCRL